MRRGAVMLYVLILITVIGLTMATYLNVATSAAKTENAREREYTANCSLEAALLALQEDYGYSTITVSSTPSYTIGGNTVSLSMTDNTSNINRTLAVTASVAVKGKTYRLSRVVGKRAWSPVPDLYALAVNANISPTSSTTITTTSSTTDGAVYCAGNVSNGGYLTVAGDLEYAGNLSGSPTVSGQTFANVSMLTFPSVSLTTYAAAGTTYSTNTVLSIPFTGSYPIWYFNPSNMSIQGPVAGKGTIVFRSGSIDGDLYYLSSSAIMGVVCSNDLSVSSSTDYMVGYYYVGGTFKTNGDVTVYGSLACNQLSLGGDLTIVYDSRIWNTESLAASLHLPGAYP